MDSSNNGSLIEIKVHTVHQLFNSMDPSPFHERDLDHDAEEFIVSWAREHQAHLPLRLIIHLGQAKSEMDAGLDIESSIHHYFEYKAAMNRRELRLMMREGWRSLLIGITFLALCVTIAHGIAPHIGSWQSVMREGLTIIGWVAMWKPLDIYLYRWWPVRGLGQVFVKLSNAPVEVRYAGN
jgi:hypothetical protein